jgi:hypothetical protein
VSPAGVVLLAVLAQPAAGAADDTALPRRVRRIVLHVLGNPAYEEPSRAWAFRPPAETQARWRSRFGTHWIVWTDGSIWPRHPGPGEGPSFFSGGDPDWRTRLARQAAPVYSHLYRGNSDSVGIEVAHSGRADDPFPSPQVQAAAWLVRSLLALSRGRLTTADVYGHKDLDRRPAYRRGRCDRRGCPTFADREGRPLRRRVDPPEGLFAALAGQGLRIPRDGREDDRELRRAEAFTRQR